jgi:hypothetical protein
MITITLSGGGKPSNERAIAFAKALAASKKQMLKEMEENYNSEEVQSAFEKLRKQNEKQRQTAV